MRELLFKNLTSVDKGRKILSLSEESSHDDIQMSFDLNKNFFFVFFSISILEDIKLGRNDIVLCRWIFANKINKSSHITKS